MRPRVVHLDLRGRDGEGALLRVRALLGDSAERDLTRLLVLDDTGELTRHHRAFEELLTSRRLELLLCVMVGHPRPAEAALTLPGNIGSGQGSGVLWVADPTGIDWRLAASAPATGRERAQSTDAGLRRLLDVLSYPEVFDRTCELAARVPGGVSSPGLRLAGVGGGQEEFLFALAAAVDRILDPDAAGPLPSPDRITELPLGAASGSPTLIPGAPLTVSYERGRQAVETAVEYAGRLQERGALFGPRLPVDELVAAAGQALRELRDRLAQLFTAAHGTAELSPAQRALIQEQGLRLPQPEGPDRAKIRETVAGYVQAGLDRETSLPRLSEGLRSLERRLTPRGSQSRIGELDLACPPALLSRLDQPPPFPPPEGWLPLYGLIVGALAALNSAFGPLSGLAMGVLWTGLVAITIVQGPGRRLGWAAVVPLGLNGVAALGGAGVGVGVSTRHPSPAVWAAGLVLALVVALVTVTGSWRARAARWAAECGIDGAAAAVEGLVAVAFQVGAQEWSEVTVRLDTVDALVRARAALDGVAGRLDAYVTSLKASLERIVRPARSSELSHFVATHLVDLVTAALAPRWRELVGDPVEHEQLAARDTGDLIASWEKHVEDHGPVEPPPFAAEREPPPPPVPSGDRSGISQATLHDPYDVMWQLCAAADLPLLDAADRSVPTVRFAPRAERAAIEDRLPADTIWIPSARHAGVLRLVPLRPGLVVHTWSDSADQAAAGSRPDPVDS